MLHPNALPPTALPPKIVGPHQSIAPIQRLAPGGKDKSFVIVR